MKRIITLTTREIIDLVQFTGLAVINCEGISEDELDTMFTIADCPPDGVLNDGEPSDPASVSHYRHIVFCTEYPEEGRTASAQRIAAFIESAVPGKPLRVTVEVARKRRSDEQNRALWGVAYKTLADATGNDPADLHEFFLGECFGWEIVEVMGQRKRRPIKRSSKLTTAEFAEFYAFIQRRAAEVGYYVPDPNETP